MPRHRWRLSRPNTRRAGTNLAGPVSCVGETRTARDAAARDSRLDAGAHAARDRRRAGDDKFPKSLAVGVRGFAVGGSLDGRSHFGAGAPTGAGQTDAGRYQATGGHGDSGTSVEGAQAGPAAASAMSRDQVGVTERSGSR